MATSTARAREPGGSGSNTGPGSSTCTAAPTFTTARRETASRPFGTPLRSPPRRRHLLRRRCRRLHWTTEGGEAAAPRNPGESPPSLSSLPSSWQPPSTFADEPAARLQTGFRRTPLHEKPDRHPRRVDAAPPEPHPSRRSPAGDPLLDDRMPEGRGLSRLVGL